MQHENTSGCPACHLDDFDFSLNQQACLLVFQYLMSPGVNDETIQKRFYERNSPNEFIDNHCDEIRQTQMKQCMMGDED